MSKEILATLSQPLTQDSGSLTVLPSREVLQQKLHSAIQQARDRLLPSRSEIATDEQPDS